MAWGLSLEGALLRGGCAYRMAGTVGSVAYEAFPRRVIIGNEDRLTLALRVIAIAVVASAFGMRKALAADPNQVLAG